MRSKIYIRQEVKRGHERIIDNLRALMKIKKITAKSVCEGLNISPNRLSRFSKEYDPEASVGIFLDILERCDLLDLLAKLTDPRNSKKDIDNLIKKAQGSVVNSRDEIFTSFFAKDE